MDAQLTLALTHAGAVAVGLLCIGSRLDGMHPSYTQATVWLQHLIAGCAMVGSLFVPQWWAAALMAVGMAAFFVAGMPRWKAGAPAGTRRPTPAPRPGEHARTH